MKNRYTKGTIVIYHYKEWRRVYYNESGYDWVSAWKRAVILSTPRDEYGRFTNDFRYESYVSVNLKDEGGKIFTTTLDNIEPDIDPASLTNDELATLWGEIVRGSMYYSDYQNSLGVFQNTALNYYEGFYEELRYEYGSDEEADWHDTAEEFAYYCQGVEYLRPSSLVA